MCPRYNDHSSWCPLPYIAVDQHRGLFGPCCYYKRAHWAHYQTIEQYWHSDELANLRQNLEQGIRDPGCGHCWTAEDHGLMSLRMVTLKDQNRWENCKTDLRVRQVKLLTGTTCNLACMMCFSTVSSTYQDLWKNDPTWIMPSTKSEPIEYDWTMDRYIRDHAEDLDAIEALGGEPLFNKDFLDLLQHLVDTGSSKHITLFVITNGTLYTERFIDLFSHFEKTVFAVSVDGVGLVNDYQRWPSNWSVIERNIQRMKEHFDISILPTITAINIIDLPRLLDYCAAKGYVVNNMAPVDHWPQLLPHNLPAKLKTLVSEEFRSMIQDQGQPDRLIDFIRRWDQRRGIDISDYISCWKSWSE